MEDALVHRVVNQGAAFAYIVADIGKDIPEFLQLADTAAGG